MKKTKQKGTGPKALNKKKILTQYRNSPLMNSIRVGTLEQLQQFQNHLTSQIRKRRIATLRSFGVMCLYVLVSAGIASLLLDAELRPFVTAFPIFFLLCTIGWSVTTGVRFFKVRVYEKLLTVLVAAAIKEKQQHISVQMLSSCPFSSERK